MLHIADFIVYILLLPVVFQIILPLAILPVGLLVKLIQKNKEQRVEFVKAVSSTSLKVA